MQGQFILFFCPKKRKLCFLLFCSRHMIGHKNSLLYFFFFLMIKQIKIRLLAAHASLKCYTYTFLRKLEIGFRDEYLALLPLFSKSSSILGKYWIRILQDYCYTCMSLHLKKKVAKYFMLAFRTCYFLSSKLWT